MYHKPVFILLIILSISKTVYCQADYTTLRTAGVAPGSFGRYGIASMPWTNTWLISPFYQKITELVVQNSNTGQNNYYGFIAEIWDKKLLIAPDGKTILTQYYNDLRHMATAPGVFVVENEKERFFFKPGKGIVSIGAFWEYVQLNNRIFKIKNGKSYSLVDVLNDYCTSPAFDDILAQAGYSKKLFIVKLQGKWGLSDFEGHQTLPCVYDTIIDAGRSFHLKKKGKWRVADTNGVIRVNGLFDSLVAVKNHGLTLIKSHNKWGMLDSNYKEIISCSYERIIAQLRTPEIAQQYLSGKYNGKWGVVSSEGKWLIPNEYDSIISTNRDDYYAIKDKKIGVVDLKNRIRFPFLYGHIERMDESSRFESSDKLYLVAKDYTSEAPESASWGVADSTGSLVMPLNANRIPLFTIYDYDLSENSYTYPADDRLLLLGYLWNNGGKAERKLILKADSVEDAAYDEKGAEYMVRHAGQDVYFTTLSGGKTGILSRSGKMLVPQLYDDLILYYSGRYDFEGSPGSISGIYSLEYDQLHQDLLFADVPIIAKKAERWGVIDLDGTELIPFRYDTIVFTNQARKDRIQMPDLFFKCYLGNKYGYYTMNGKKLSEPGIEGELYSFKIAVPDSFLRDTSKHYGRSVDIRILVDDTSARVFNWYTYQREYDAAGNKFMAPLTNKFYYYGKAKFQFKNSTTNALMAEQWSDDVILSDQDFNLYKLSTLAGQVKVAQITDSLFDAATGKTVYYKKGTLTNNSYADFSNYAFFKIAGKWYLHDFLNQTLINKNNGFDSISSVNKTGYVAWTNGQFAFYNYNYTGPFDLERTLDFPNEPGVNRLACRKCEYKLKSYPLKRTDRLFNKKTNTYRDTVVNYTLQIPVISSGKFNIINASNLPLLKTWADDVFLPSANGFTFSLRDTSGSVFNENNFLRIGYPFLDTHTKSIALKYSGAWRLTSIEKQDQFIDGFSAVRIEGDNWVVKKKNKEFYYSISDLKKTEKNKLK